MSTEKDRAEAAAASLANAVNETMRDSVGPIFNQAIAGGAPPHVIVHAAILAMHNMLASVVVASCPRGEEPSLAFLATSQFIERAADTDWTSWRDLAEQTSRAGAGEQVRPC